MARNREKGVTLAQIAKDFGVHEMTLSKWLRQAAARRSGPAHGGPSTRNRACRLRRTSRPASVCVTVSVLLRRTARCRSSAGPTRSRRTPS
ncbi:helix-turn-helix domain-containing protein [Streptomyces sp. NRRL F-5065]|uniref:helix-turn-helix domain-containing protein n=1 Tax=Streptomyces sp. NRRL F-5065 TaxID=1463855 RepID=UPI0018FE5F43